MDLRQLETFVAVVSAGSLTAAGQALGRSQSAVTRIIQDLEQELGLMLFERSGPRITPTEHAFELLGYAENALHSVRRIEERVRGIRKDDAPDIYIGATPALANSVVPVALHEITVLHGPQRVHVRNLFMATVVEAVLSRSVDIGVVTLPLEHKDLRAHWVRESACVAVLPESHPLATRDCFPLAALDGQPLVTMNGTFRLRGRVNEALGRQTVKPSRIVETNASLTAMRLAQSSGDVAIIEPATAHSVPIKGLAVKPLDAHIPFYFGAITLKGKPLSHSLEYLIRMLEEAADKALPGSLKLTPETYAATLGFDAQ